VPVDVDYVGFDVPDKYVFGYGIDIDDIIATCVYRLSRSEKYRRG